MKKYIINQVAIACGMVGIGLAMFGFCGAIICTIKVFPAMAGIGTAIVGIAQFFMEG